MVVIFIFLLIIIIWCLLIFYDKLTLAILYCVVGTYDDHKPLFVGADEQ